MIILLLVMTFSLFANEGEKLFKSKCQFCHGAKGEGSEFVPRLVTLNKIFVAKALRYFKTGKRKSDKMDITFKITLSESKIVSVSEYIQGLK